MKIVLKELKECRVTLKIIIRRKMIPTVEKLNALFKETEQLIAITGAGIQTAKKNLNSPANKLEH